MRIFLLLTFLFLHLLAFSQDPTVGLTEYTDQSSGGYTFFCPLPKDCYLVDECGLLVNSWEQDSETGLSARLLENGLMLRTRKSDQNDFFESATGGFVDLIDWENNTVGSYKISNEEIIQHHDALMMPNGNLLFLAWKKFTAIELLEFGAETDNLWYEVLQEITLLDNSQYEIVWEWNLKNHLIQNVNSALSNYAIIEDNIGKVNINYRGPDSGNDPDRWHCNAIDYNEDLDQIIINARHNSELWIIDHSTTLDEAASNTGGNSGKGGQLLFRWGNPEAYNQGDIDDVKMYGSHGTYWIPEGLPNGGKIMYFNNGTIRPEGKYSTIEMIDPIELDSSAYELNEEKIFFPLEPELVYVADNPFDFKSIYLSNAHQLSNGNVFINEGSSSRFFEINPTDNTIVWEYISPAYWSGFIPQGVTPSNNPTFRAYSYDENFPGFEGKDLNGGLPLELEPYPSLCITDSNLNESYTNEIEIYPNPSSDFINIKSNFTTKERKIYLTNIYGQKVIEINLNKSNRQIDIRQLEDGIYFIHIQKDGLITNKKFVKY